jgi:two-component system, chemotaxis family, sensor kinase CheA
MGQEILAFGSGAVFHAIFFEEAREHLGNIEAILLGLDIDAPAPDHVNEVFRAVHSIKGSAGMLGFAEIAGLTHVFENLLDLLRKYERPVFKEDIDAMLLATDLVKLQLVHRSGELLETPEVTEAAQALRNRVAYPDADEPDGERTPTLRKFAVCLGPLPKAIDQAELDMMLTGLAEMGSVENQVIQNAEGGQVIFEVALAGTEMDLHSVLSLVVAPELIAIEPQVTGVVSAQKPVALPVAAEHDVFFVDTAKYQRRGKPPDAIPSPIANQPPLPIEAEGMATLGPSVMGRWDDAPKGNSALGGSGSIRVSTEKIDALVNLVGELVITEAMLSRERSIENSDGRNLSDIGLLELARHTRNLQEAVFAIRMVPISNLFARFPRLVRELSDRMGKRIDLKFSGETTELDRGLIEKISDPLTHLIRNAIGHGLETPEQRIAAGKAPVGLISLTAGHRGGKIVIEVGDDGSGLDRERILARAEERHMAVSRQASDAEVWQLIFQAGFSTAEKVTEISGRGVGMDVVKRNIHSLGGTVEIVSKAGYGMSVTVSVPLTLAIIDGMTVSVSGEVYVLPLGSVIESRSIQTGEIRSLPGQGETLRVRDDYLQVLRLSHLFPPGKAIAHDRQIAVIIETESGKSALIVDQLVGQQQVVVKSLETNYRKIPGLSGATIMADGSVAFILDVSCLPSLPSTPPPGWAAGSRDA